MRMPGKSGIRSPGNPPDNSYLHLHAVPGGMFVSKHANGEGGGHTASNASNLSLLRLSSARARSQRVEEGYMNSDSMSMTQPRKYI